MLPESVVRVARRSLPAWSKTQPAIFSVFLRTSVRLPVAISSLYTSCHALSRSLRPMYRMPGSDFGTE